MSACTISLEHSACIHVKLLETSAYMYVDSLVICTELTVTLYVRSSGWVLPLLIANASNQWRRFFSAVLANSTTCGTRPADAQWISSSAIVAPLHGTSTSQQSSWASCFSSALATNTDIFKIILFIETFFMTSSFRYAANKRDGVACCGWSDLISMHVAKLFCADVIYRVGQNVGPQSHDDNSVNS